MNLGVGMALTRLGALSAFAAAQSWLAGRGGAAPTAFADFRNGQYGYQGSSVAVGTVLTFSTSTVGDVGGSDALQFDITSDSVGDDVELAAGPAALVDREGTIYIEVTGTTAQNDTYLDVSADGSNRLTLFHNGGNMSGSILDGGVGQGTLTGPGNLSSISRVKLALGWSDGDTAVYVNGSTTTTNAGTPPDGATIAFGRRYQDGLTRPTVYNMFNMGYWETRRSDAELEALTS